SCKHEAGAAANLKKTFGTRKIIAERPLNELIAHAKPKVCLLNRGKPWEIFWLKAAGCRVLRKLNYFIAQSWTQDVPGADPIVALKASFACEAAFHFRLALHHFSHSRTIV